MKVQDVMSIVQAQALSDSVDLEVVGCYISDLLSDVLAHASPGMLWITIQTHHNVISVASMKDIAAVLFTCGRKPDGAIIAEAEEHGIMLLSTPLSSFEAAGRLWQAGLRM